MTSPYGFSPWATPSHESGAGEIVTPAGSTKTVLHVRQSQQQPRVIPHAAVRRSPMKSTLHQLNDTELAQLAEWVRSQTSPHRLVVRSRIVLLASHGESAAAIARRLRVSPATVRLWCSRFETHGLAALTHDAPGRGRRPGMSREKVVAALRGLRHFVEAGLPCTIRGIAAWAHVSPATVWRVGQRYQVSPQSTVTEINAAMEKAISETRKDVA